MINYKADLDHTGEPIAQGLNGNTVLQGEVSQVVVKKQVKMALHIKNKQIPELQPHCCCCCHLTLELSPSFRTYALWI